MYRQEWVVKILNGRSVLDTALDVHMTSRGSFERERSLQIADLRALNNVVADWENHGICDFDDAVLSLVKAAIEEAENTKQTRSIYVVKHWNKCYLNNAGCAGSMEIAMVTTDRAQAEACAAKAPGQHEILEAEDGEEDPI